MLEIPPERRLSFDRIASHLDEAINVLEGGFADRWPQRFAAVEAARPYLRLTVLVSRNTYYSSILLLQEKPASPLRALSVPPLARTILDSLFTVVFIFEDPATRWEWFARSAWREEHEAFRRLSAKHGSDPAFAVWLSDLANLNGFLKLRAGVTSEEEADPKKKIRFFPNPGGMAREAKGARRDFLLYLNDWFYRELSAASHLSLAGMAKRAGALLGPDDAKREAILDKHRSDYAFTTITLLLALLTELEIEFRYGCEKSLRQAWSTLCPYWPEADNLFDQRHRDLL